jgi:TRAP-type C4-dicarboxylate transport system permease small subunit
MEKIMKAMAFVDKVTLNTLKFISIVSFILLTILAIDVTNVFAIPKRILYSCMPVAGAVMVIYSLRNIAVELARIVKPAEKEA